MNFIDINQEGITFMTDFTSRLFGSEFGATIEPQPHAAPKSKSPELLAYEDMEVRRGAERITRMFASRDADFLRKVAAALNEQANKREAANAR